jgi:hypothetical protein
MEETGANEGTAPQGRKGALRAALPGDARWRSASMHLEGLTSSSDPSQGSSYRPGQESCHPG